MPSPKAKEQIEQIRILVVEDDGADKEFLRQELKRGKMDRHIKFISTGRDALKFLLDLENRTLIKGLVAIFMDLKLPSPGGAAFLRHLRRHQEYAEIPVVVMASPDDGKELEECESYKITKVVQKPVKLTAFAKSVADVFHSANRRPIAIARILRE
jgi:CheY-like chemotaxis protein